MIFELNIPIDVLLCKEVKNRLNPIVGIYKITSPDGKIYIGQAGDIENRFSTYKICNCKSQSKLYNSLKKYGVINHTFKVIHLCSKIELNELEIYYGKLFNVTDREVGLNIRECGGNRGKLSPETIRKIIESKSGEKHHNFGKVSYFFGKKHTEEAKNKLREIKRGFRHTNESKAKMSENSKWDFLPFNEAKKWVLENAVSNGIDGIKKWKKIPLPNNIPRTPQNVYKEWISWYDWFNKEKIQRLNYEEARKFVIENIVPKGINNVIKWRNEKSFPLNIPKRPDIHYKNRGWKNWNDWFGKFNYN